MMDDTRHTESPDAHVWASDTSDEHTLPSGKVAFTIGELSREFGVTLRALRFYENKGLISPQRDGLSRLYSPGDRNRLALILKGKKLGFTLTEISRMIDAQAGHASEQALKLTAEKCLEQIAYFERQLREAGEALAELRRIHLSLCVQTTQRGGKPEEGAV